MESTPPRRLPLISQAAFVASCGAMVAVALFAYQISLQGSITKLNADSARVSSGLEHNQDFRNSLSREKSLLLTYVRKGDPADLDALGRQRAVSDRAWSSAAATPREADEARIFGQIAAARDEWNRFVDSAAALPAPRNVTPVVDTAADMASRITVPDDAYIADLEHDVAADVSAIGRTARMGLEATVVGTALLLVALIAVAVLFVNRLARPMETLSTVATRMASDPDTVIPLTERNDEVGDLARGLAGWKIAELARRAADRENVTRSRFMSNMSHELRTPLNAIIGFSELLLDDQPRSSFDGETRKEFLSTINASGQHLLSLVNDLLDLAKVGAERMDARAEPVNLTETVTSALASLLPLALPKQISLIAEPGPDVIALGDQRMVRQILLNLVSNAVKFTPEGGNIRVGARTVDEHAEVFVKDTGAGIPLADQERVFGEFEQIKSADGLSQQGTGLGLALSLALARRMAGSITLESRLGEGSTFTLSLPSQGAART